MKGILSWMVARALHIQRLPWMGDRVYATLPAHANFRPAINYMAKNPGEVDDACEELRRIHEHTIAYFCERGETSITLGRGYKDEREGEPNSGRFGSYARAVMRKASACTFQGIDAFDVPHDLLTSWNSSGVYTQCRVGVTRAFELDEILCSAETISPREDEIQYSALESGETIVINRRMDGLMTLPAAGVFARDGYHWGVIANEDEANQALAETIPVLQPYVPANCASYIDRKYRQRFSFRARMAWETLWNKYQ